MKTNAEISGKLKELQSLANYAKQKRSESANTYVQEMRNFRHNAVLDQIIALRWVLENEQPWPREIWYSTTEGDSQ